MNEELNKKLAEWAGWEEQGDVGIRGWIPPIADNVIYLDCPSFTSSLDACFKWLMPKAIKEFGELKTRWMLKDWINSISTDIEYSLPIASSLCLAIEKLIDAEEV